MRSTKPYRLAMINLADYQGVYSRGEWPPRTLLKGKECSQLLRYAI